MTNLIMKSHSFFRIIALSMGICLAQTSHAVTVNDFGSTEPSTAILANTAGPNGTLMQWRNNAGNSRSVMPTFKPLENCRIEAVILQCAGTGSTTAGIHFTLSVIELTSFKTPPSPEQLAKPIQSETGTLPVPVVPTKNFVSFTFDKPVFLKGGTVYGFKLTMTDQGAVGNAMNFYNAGSAPSNIGTVWISADEGVTFTNSQSTYLIYFQGAAASDASLKRQSAPLCAVLPDPAISLLENNLKWCRIAVSPAAFAGKPAEAQ